MHEQDPHVTQQHGAARDVGHHSRTHVDQIMSKDRGRETDEADGDDARRLAGRGQDGVQRLSAGHEGGRRISQVHDDDERDDEGGAERAELTPALHHLRHAESRTLRGMECHENGAHEVPHDDGDAAPEEGLPEYRRGERTGHDGQYVDVGAQPESEQMARLAVPLIERDLIDRVLFDSRRPLSASHHGRAHRDGKSLASVIGEQYSHKERCSSIFLISA